MGKGKKKLTAKAKEAMKSALQADVLALAVHPEAEGFREKVEPQKLPESVFLYKCTCGGIHFRHAGYVNLLLPFLKGNSEKSVAFDDLRVMVCVACKKSFVRVEQKTYDITDRIDLTAWEKTEREAHQATGPGGEC